MEFHIDNHSAIPPDRQVQEQIGLAVSFGQLRNGDLLPSIRDVEKQTGVNRGLIHKAYRNLQRAGIVVTARGKRAVISSQTVSTDRLARKCEKLSNRVLSEVRTLGISPMSFSRYLRRRAEENERRSPLIAYVSPAAHVAQVWAAEISRIWQVHVSGMTPPQLKHAIRQGHAPQTVLCLFFDYNKVRGLTPRTIEVIPISVSWTKAEARLLERIEANSRVLLVLADEYRRVERVFVEQLEHRMNLKISEIRAIVRSKLAAAQLKRGKYDYVIVVPGMTVDTMAPDLRTDPRVILIKGELGAQSLEAARIRAGVIA